MDDGCDSCDQQEVAITGETNRAGFQRVRRSHSHIVLAASKRNGMNMLVSSAISNR